MLASDGLPFAQPRQQQHNPHSQHSQANRNSMMAYSPSSPSSAAGAGDLFMAPSSAAGGGAGVGGSSVTPGLGGAAGGGHYRGSPSVGSAQLPPALSEGMRRGFSYDSASGTRPPTLQTQTSSSSATLLPSSFNSPSISSSSRAAAGGLYSPMTGITPSLSSTSSSASSSASPRLPPAGAHSPHPGSARAYSPSHYAAQSGPSSLTSIPPPPLSSAYRASQAAHSSSHPPPPPASSFYPQHIAQSSAYNPASAPPSGASASPLPSSGSLAQARDRERERLGGSSTPAHHPRPEQYYQSSSYLSHGNSPSSAGGPSSASAQGHGQHGQQGSYAQQQQHHGHAQGQGSMFSSSAHGSADLRHLSLSSHPSSHHSHHSHHPSHASHPSNSHSPAPDHRASNSPRRRKGLQRVRDVREIRRGGVCSAAGEGSTAQGSGQGQGNDGQGGQGGGGQGGTGQGGGQGRRAAPEGGWVSPLKALTTSLPSTFSLINPLFAYETSRNPRRVLTKPSKPAQNDGFDNEDSDYILYVNDVLGPEEKDRYLILDVLGQGTFGQVVKCQNLQTHEIVAVKVVKNKPAYFQQSMMEVTILELINNTWDKDDEHHMLRLKDTFIHHSHLCLVFELLSNNLYELIKQNSFRGLSTSLVRVFTAQLLDSLSVLNEAKIIHCDLKPENILLKSLQSPTIKVIDFGSACHEKQTVYTYIQSRFYRSPEVILSLPYSSMIDMWSLGCICVELFLGLPLFPGTSEFNQITRIVEMLGMPPDAMLDKGKQTSHFFEQVVADEYGRRRWKLKSLERYAQEYKANEQPSKKYFSATTLPDIIKQYPIVRKGLKEAEVDKEMRNRIAFIDFVQGLLHLDPEQRWTPQQAKLHPFVLGEPLLAPFVPPPRHVAAASAKSGSPPTGGASSSSSRQPYGGMQPAPGQAQGPGTPRRTYDAKSYQQQVTAQQQQQQQQAAAAAAQQQQQQQAAAAHAHAQAQAQAQAHAAAQAQAQAAQAQAAAYARAAQPSLYGAAAGGFAPRSAPIPGPGGAGVGVGVANPPPVHYGGTRGRSGTMSDGAPLPPALQKLGHELMQGQGAGQSITPVLRRDDQWQAWEQQYAGGNGVQRRISISTRNPHLNLLQEQAESGLNSWNSPARAKPHAHQHSHQQHQQYASPNVPSSAGFYPSPLAPSQPQFAVVVDPSRPGNGVSSGGGDLFDPIGGTGGITAPPLAYAGGSRYAPYPSSAASSSALGAPAPPSGAAPSHHPGGALVDSSSTSPFDTLSASHHHGHSLAHHSPHLTGDPLAQYSPLQPYQQSPNLGRTAAGGMGPGPPGVYSPNVPQGGQGFAGQQQQGQGGKPKGLW